MSSWQVQDAKARFSEFLDLTLKKGPQIVTRHGVETAVLVPIEEWRRLQRAARPGLKELLLAETPRVEHLLPERRPYKRRKPVGPSWPGRLESCSHQVGGTAPVR